MVVGLFVMAVKIFKIFSSLKRSLTFPSQLFCLSIFLFQKKRVFFSQVHLSVFLFSNLVSFNCSFFFNVQHFFSDSQGDSTKHFPALHSLSSGLFYKFISIVKMFFSIQVSFPYPVSLLSSISFQVPNFLCSDFFVVENFLINSSRFSSSSILV